MAATTGEGLVIVTGASGHIGREVCRILRAAGEKILPLDVNPDTREDVIACDLRSKNDVSRLFQSHRVQTVIHLAAILPSAFQADPLVGAEVNLSGCFELMRQAVDGRIKRFVFTSSMSVYGSRSATHPLSEDDPAVPDEPYGASKRVVELVGQTLAGGHAFELYRYASPELSDRELRGPPLRGVPRSSKHPLEISRSKSRMLQRRCCRWCMWRMSRGCL
jgi:nucleoside-diphosphate-sugar epimerase